MRSVFSRNVVFLRTRISESSVRRISVSVAIIKRVGGYDMHLLNTSSTRSSHPPHPSVAQQLRSI
jgi:hypothetical protein